MIRKDLWGKLLRQASTRPYLALLVIASILLSIASFYTTFDGLSDFLAHAVFAAFITLAIQSLLFVTSWRLGFMVADREPVAWIDVGVFSVCFVLSVFFSFVSLFNVVFSPEQQDLARITRVHNGVTEAIEGVGEKARERRRDLVQDLIRSPEYAAWSRNVTAVADLAADSEGILAKVFAESHERRRQRAEQLAREAYEVAAGEKTLARALRDDEAALARAEERRGPLEKVLAQLRTELGAAEDAVVAKQHEMDAEERGVGATGRPNRGPVWNGLAKERQRLIVAKETLANRIALEERRLRDQDTERAAIQARIDRAREQQVGIAERIAAAAQAAEEARRDLGAAGAESSGLDLGQSVHALRAALPKFATTLDLTHFEDAAALCKGLFSEMAAIPVLESRLAGLSCDRGPMLTLLNPIDEAAAALVALERDCLPGGAGTKTVDDLSFDEALTYGRGCLELASLPSEATRRARRELDRLAREESPAASPFTKTTNALLAREKLAVFALAIALAIDLLVLFTGLIGAKTVEGGVEAPVPPILPTDTHQVRLYKHVLAAAHAATDKIDGVRYEHRVVLSGIADEAERERVRQFLVHNTTKGNVRPAPGREGEFLLRYGVAEELRTWLREQTPEPWLSPPAPRPAQAPPPSGRTPEPQRPAAPARPPRTLDDLDFDFVPVQAMDLAAERQGRRGPQVSATAAAAPASRSPETGAGPRDTIPTPEATAEVAAGGTPAPGAERGKDDGALRSLDRFF